MRTLAALLLAAAAAAAQCTPAAGYGFCRTLTIDHTQVPNTDQSSFPVLISKTVTEWKTTGNGGHIQNTTTLSSVTVPADLIFTSDSGGTTQIAGWEVKAYTATTGAINIHANIATVSHTADTVFYASYGNSAVTTYQTTAANTWNAAYSAVYHLDDNLATVIILDSTSNGRTAAIGVNSNTQSAAGEVNLAQVIGSDPLQNMGTNVFNNPGTISALVLDPTLTDFETIASNADSNNGARLVYGNSVNLDLQFSGGHGAAICANNISTSAWNYTAGTYSGNGGTGICYLGRVGTDTSLGATTGALGTATAPGTPNFIVGRRGDNIDNISATVDEVRFSNVVRTADWLNTEYHSLTSPGTFITVGTEVAGGGVRHRAISN